MPMQWPIDLEQDYCRHQCFLILVTINKLLIIRHSHLLSNLLLSVISMYFAVLSSDPVKPGVLLCQEQLSFLRRQMLSQRTLKSNRQERGRGDLGSLGDAAWLRGQQCFGVNGGLPFDFR